MTTPAEYFQHNKKAHQKALEMMGHPVRKDDTVSKITITCPACDYNTQVDSDESFDECDECGVALQQRQGKWEEE